MKRRRAANKPLWMQQNVLRVIRKKKRLWSTYQKSKDYEEYLAYKRVEREVRSLVKQAKRKFERKLAKEAKKKPKQFYAYLKSRTSNKQTIGPLKKGDQIISDNTKMATLLNDFFVSVFTKEDKCVPDAPNYNLSSQLNEVVFPASDIETKISVLKPGGAFGPDKISTRVLKETGDILAYPLSILFTRSLIEGVVPEDWRRANVTPIFKKGSKMTPGNYRPVSLTCIICKIMESLIRDKIVDHLVENELIRSSQHGFTIGKSCQTNLLEYLNTLTRLVDSGYNVDVLYLDFAKAFDKVPHQRLLLKLESHGITGKVLQWISSWLSGRQQRVVLNGCASEWSSVTSGVPQGSVLGPTCFIIFINDIDEVLELVNGFVYKFADDTKYGRVVNNEDDREEMQRNINKLMEWADKWQMDFNTTKCKVLHMGPSNQRFVYTMGGYAPGGTILENVTEEKDIGVIIHESLKPSQQCSKAVKKANSILGQMRRTVHYRDRIVWIGLYKTFVRHHLEFSVQAWSPWFLQDIQNLERVQERAVNMVSGLDGYSYEEKLQKIGLPSLFDRRVRGDVIQVWKYLHCYPSTLNNPLLKVVRDHDLRITRHSSKPLDLIKPKARLDIRKHFFAIRCVDTWNSLPGRIQGIEDFEEFKKEYDKFIAS
jgi:hypothetical protein